MVHPVQSVQVMVKKGNCGYLNSTVKKYSNNILDFTVLT